MKQIRRCAVSLGLLVAFGSAIGGQAGSQADLKKLYGSRWIPLPMFDSRIGPGSIISIRRGQVAWESSLDTCGAPPDVMKAVPSAGTNITSATQGEYGANAALQIHGVTAGPEFSKVKKASLKLEDHHAEGIDRIKLGEWFNKPGTVLSPTCRQFLTQNDVFIVQEAYKVGKGELTLYDNANTKLSLTGLNIGIVKLDAGAHVTKTANSTLEFSEPVYTAIRRVKYFKNGELRTLGTPGGAKVDDAAALKILYPQ